MSDATLSPSVPTVPSRLIGFVICLALGVGCWFLLHSVGEENVWAKTGLFLFILFFLLGSGVWVGLALMAVAYIGLDVFAGGRTGDRMLTTIWTSSSSWTLTALPLFIWMGEVLFRTRLSQDMFKGLSPWMARLPGGLLHTNVVGCTVFAAVSGSSAATLTTVGKMSIPELRRRKYPEFMTIGTLAGSATLGLMIPPSLTLIVYGVTINESITKLFIAGILPGLVLAAMFMGYCAVWYYVFKSQRPETLQASGPLRLAWNIGVLVGIGLAIAFLGLPIWGAIALFAALALGRAIASGEIDPTAAINGKAIMGLISGVAFCVILMLLWATAQWIPELITPPTDTAPLGLVGFLTQRHEAFFPGAYILAAVVGYVVGARRNDDDFADKLWNSRFLIPVICLILAVIGSMYQGLATPTEAAAIGVIGALILAAIQGSLNWGTFTDSLMGATRTSAMIALILMGAAALAQSMGFTGLPRALAEWIASMELSVFTLIAALTIFFIIIGCFLDGISSVVLTMAVIEPMVNIPAFQDLGFSMIWFGIFVVVVVEMAQITPPIGFNLFVLQGMIGKEIGYIAKTAIPMFLIMVVMVAVLVAFPELATWLPDTARTTP